MIPILLLLLGTLGERASVECPTVIGTISGDTVTCERLSVPVERASCRDFVAALRGVAVEKILRDAGAYPTNRQVELAIDEFIPSVDAYRAAIKESRDRTTALSNALRESEQEPVRDREIWKVRLSSFMSYEAWVSFRTQMKGRVLEVPGVERPATEAEYLRARADLKPFVLEILFQEWLRDTWSVDTKSLRGGALEPRQQDAFWAEYLRQHEVTISDSLHCPSVVASDLREPIARRPSSKAAPRLQSEK